MREKSAQISFRLSDGLAREFKILCVTRGTTMQDTLEKAVEDIVEKAKRNPE